MKNLENKEVLKKDWIKEAKKTDNASLQKALDFAVSIVSDNLEELHGKAVFDAGKDGEYPAKTIEELFPWCWTSSFWVGMVWLAYEATGEDRFKQEGLYYSKLFNSVCNIRDYMYSHDLGFLYSLSCVAGYKLTGDQTSREGAILAAKHMLEMFSEKSDTYSQGVPVHAMKKGERVNSIIDCCMNLPLQFWAAQETGDRKFYDAASRHINKAALNLVRESGAVHQNMRYNKETGELLEVLTTQGKGGEDACWGRGQAWAIYGFALSYAYTGEKRYLQIAKICANYFLNRVQSDYIVNWDLYYTKDSDQRDTSASSTAACGLLEIARHLPVTDPERTQYEAAAKVIINSLTENYRYKREETKNALLRDGVYTCKTNDYGEPTVWGDYFYMEALERLTHIHRIFW